MYAYASDVKYDIGTGSSRDHLPRKAKHNIFRIAKGIKKSAL